MTVTDTTKTVSHMGGNYSNSNNHHLASGVTVMTVFLTATAVSHWDDTIVTETTTIRSQV